VTALPQQFVQYFRQGTWSETAVVGPVISARTRAPSDAPYLRLPGHRTAVVKRLIAAPMHLVANALYVSPALVIVAAVLPPPYDALIAVGFAALVTLFFFLLVLFILWSIIHHATTRNLVASLDPPDDEASLARGADGDDWVQATGVVTALRGEPPGTPVLVDLWCTSATPPWRAVAATDFAVVEFGQPALIVRSESAPLLLCEDEPGRFVESLDLLPPELRQRLRSEARADLEGSIGGEARVLCVGDAVELRAPLARELPNVARLELGGEVISFDPSGRGRDAPYRGGPGEPGRLLTSLPDRAARLRRVRRGP